LQQTQIQDGHIAFHESVVVVLYLMPQKNVVPENKNNQSLPTVYK
jgi:hypothetical protein